MWNFAILQDWVPRRYALNKNLLSSAREAYSLYNAGIEEVKLKKAEKLKKKQEQAVLDEKLKKERLLNAKKMASLEDKERSLQKAEKAVMQTISVINQLLYEGYSKLADALKKNDITNAKIAQIMIDTAAKDSSKHSDELKAI